MCQQTSEIDCHFLHFVIARNLTEFVKHLTMKKFGKYEALVKLIQFWGNNLSCVYISA